MVNFGGGSIKSLILSFNIQKCEFCAQIYALYSFRIIFSQIFSFAALARLRFIAHLEMKACNVLYQLHLLFVFGVIISDWQLPKFTKTHIQLHKIVYTMSKNCLHGVADKGGGVRRENGPWGNSAMVVGGRSWSAFVRRFMLREWREHGA